ncbi:DUF58 domain-containing protein [Pleionea litopenaei]|uniref:DUF58 domain-containing protein n=1 Tax=Pleionea litopenaei TaxID=3070815 RepID=A0AA51RTP4_9GAMM|nr:DUF58 domain-containing protein [Pleionea sp. HL-JVS1]WMS87468.1 DUF58 domain-containing protein [Pleionea sp. HL-JVS1]
MNQHWRKSNPAKHFSDRPHQMGVELSLAELLECKRMADNLKLPTMQKVKTHLLGGFISYYKGRGMDFDEARPYQQGDDIRSIDWRVTARTGDAHTKIFREERERPVFVLLDQTHSMMFGSKVQFKSVQAAKLAATIMWKTLGDGNRFGALLFNDFRHQEFKPASSRKNTLRILNDIVLSHAEQLKVDENKASSSSASPIAVTLKRARHLIKPGSLVFVLSDFLQFNDESEHHLVRLAQHNDINLITLFDPLEQQLPPAGLYPITNGSKRTILNTESSQTREEYQRLFSEKVQHMDAIALKHRMKHHQLATNENLTQRLSLSDGQGLRR